MFNMSIKNDKKGIIEQTVLVTGTHYPDPDNFRTILAKEMIRKAIEMGYTTVVVDNGPNDKFVREIQSYGTITDYVPELKMGAQRRYAFQVANDLGKQVIAWTEPEKTTYLSEIVKTAEPILNGEGEIMIPRRRNLDSYPTIQKELEPVGNSFFKELTGHDLDVWMGSRSWDRSMSNYFLNYDGKYGDMWDSINIPVLRAIVDCKKVMGVTVDYVNPAIQTQKEEKHAEDFRDKRETQLSEITRCFYDEYVSLKAMDPSIDIPQYKALMEKAKMNGPFFFRD